MSEMLSQAEIDALLGETDDETDDNLPLDNGNTDFTAEEIDALGEVGNISMGTSATTLSTLLSNKVLITTPKVSIIKWAELAKQYPVPYVAVKVAYTYGLQGNNLLIVEENDAKIISDLMMGGKGIIFEGELEELHLSAIGEAMNQMIGSSATSMSSLFGKRIDISPPGAFIINFRSSTPFDDFKLEDKVVKIAFSMIIGDLIDSEIMLLLPPHFAKTIVDSLLQSDIGDVLEEKVDIEIDELTVDDSEVLQSINELENEIQSAKLQSLEQEDNQLDINVSETPYHNDDGGIHMRQNDEVADNSVNNQVNVQPAQFQTFEQEIQTVQKENINIIMDVPLEITAELGKTKRLIKEILEFSPGSIIELDKLTGEPIDILINGKVIAIGEVVVIDDNFGIRITDIVNPSERI